MVDPVSSGVDPQDLRLQSEEVELQDLQRKARSFAGSVVRGVAGGMEQVGRMEQVYGIRLFMKRIDCS